MSASSGLNERSKYQYLLQLSNEQVRALHLGDLPTFDRILAAKRKIIEGLVDARNMVKNDPALKSIVDQIQLNDKTAERLLFRKIGFVRRQLSEIQQFQSARRAYGRNSSRLKKMPFVVDENTPRFFDQSS